MDGAGLIRGDEEGARAPVCVPARQGGGASAARARGCGGAPGGGRRPGSPTGAGAAPRPPPQPATQARSGGRLGRRRPGEWGTRQGERAATMHSCASPGRGCVCQLVGAEEKRDGGARAPHSAWVEGPKGPGSGSGSGQVSVQRGLVGRERTRGRPRGGVAGQGWDLIGSSKVCRGPSPPALSSVPTPKPSAACLPPTPPEVARPAAAACRPGVQQERPVFAPPPI
ncbi:MAG: hypothetical protein J3K34DRAFT_181533 [Monoraphidium minutum]|nr:MAG: hypothetical protein J3K34DRAFT_181533 [Monoraphidium minutum]